ncbi:MAG: BamA/TamA family outer membrane protein [Chitinophagaceae bacterium]|nr:BamA/TamA family outer membrane protein [Chitinophagaceae bacterium]
MKYTVFICLFIVSCTIPRKYQKDKPFVAKNKIEVKGGNFSKEERATLKQRLNAQLDDSSRIKVIDKLFFWHVLVSPPAYDSNSAAISARNMETSMLHVGYYNAKATFSADTVKSGNQQRVHVSYLVEVNKPTLIDTFSYIMRKPDLQKLAVENIDKTLIKEGKPVTKAAVIGELNRLVELYRNNGYYKFTSEEVVMRGDTTVAALTTITDDIFEQLRLLAEAQAARDSPTIKLAVVLKTPKDSNRLKPYYINNIYFLPDYRNGDNINDTGLTRRYLTNSRRLAREKCDTCKVDTNFIMLYHKYLFRPRILVRNMYLRKGNLYNQADFYKSLNAFARAGVWQSTNIVVEEVKSKDSSNKLDLIVQLIPAKKFGYEASLEASYSASSNTNSVTAANAGNLLGVSGNISFLNRNLNKEGIKMTNSLLAGVEFNLKPDSNNRKNLINSNEISYTNNISFPRLIFPFAKFSSDKRFISTESFITTRLSYINRINLFNLQSFNFGVGYAGTTKKNRQWTFKPLNFEFAKLYNETDSFKKTLADNPFLRYSFNTSLVAGSSIGYRINKVNPLHPNRQHSFKINLEESGLLWGRLGILKQYMRQYVKTDVEYIYSVSRPKTAFVFRIFGGIGIASKKDTTLPFFKQYFGGGSNSMRGWPVRGIGRGGQPLSPYGSNSFNDRTGDIQLETNIEYRYTIAQIIPNSLVLKGALFADIGNVWNFRNSKPGGGTDSAQFQFANLYKQLGVSAGTGFRLDFNYFVLRFDFGFRFKRPDVAKNDGWQIPDINFNNLFRRGVKVPDPLNPGSTYNDNRYKKWRYENYNLTIGISYPF